MYGKELILDIHNCFPKRFNRDTIELFFENVCRDIDMERCDLHFWDYEDCDPEEYNSAPDHLKGISAVQFISTSNITIHTLDILRKVFINVFSCKFFDSQKVGILAERFFEGEIVNQLEITRI